MPDGTVLKWHQHAAGFDLIMVVGLFSDVLHMFCCVTVVSGMMMMITRRASATGAIAAVTEAETAAGTAAGATARTAAADGKPCSCLFANKYIVAVATCLSALGDTAQPASNMCLWCVQYLGRGAGSVWWPHIAQENSNPVSRHNVSQWSSPLTA